MRVVCRSAEHAMSKPVVARSDLVAGLGVEPQRRTREVRPAHEPRRVYSASSLDGFIAGDGNDVSWLEELGP